VYVLTHYASAAGGKMFPGLGRIHVAPVSDEALYGELQGKAAFWLQPDFYGVDISCLHAPALKDYFSQASKARSQLNSVRSIGLPPNKIFGLSICRNGLRLGFPGIVLCRFALRLTYPS